jgi:hypothetical protein
MAGAEAQGVNLVRAALEILKKSLAMIPLGSELETATIKAVSDLGKHVSNMAGAGDPAAVVRQLAALAQEQRMQPTPAALQGGGAGGPPGGMPPMGGGGPPPMQ